MAKVNLNNINVGVQEFSTLSDKISISDLYPQPMTSNVVFADIDLKNSTQLRYDIYNMAGQRVTASDWKKYSAGSHTLSIDLDYASGSYYVKIMNDSGYFKSMKLVK